MHSQATLSPLGELPSEAPDSTFRRMGMHLEDVWEKPGLCLLITSLSGWNDIPREWWPGRLSVFYLQDSLGLQCREPPGTFYSVIYKLFHSLINSVFKTKFTSWRRMLPSAHTLVSRYSKIKRGGGGERMEFSFLASSHRVGECCAGHWGRLTIKERLTLLCIHYATQWTGQARNGHWCNTGKSE